MCSTLMVERVNLSFVAADNWRLRSESQRRARPDGFVVNIRVAASHVRRPANNQQRLESSAT